MGVKAALPQYELGFYALALTCALAYSVNGLLEASADGMNRKIFKDSVSPGWQYLGRKMEVADFEWMMWFTTFRNHIIFALLGHVLFAKFSSMLIPQLRSWVCMLYGILTVSGIMGNNFLMLILSHCVILYIASLIKQRWLCITTGIISLATFKIEPFSRWQILDLEIWSRRPRSQIIVTARFCTLCSLVNSLPAMPVYAKQQYRTLDITMAWHKMVQEGVSNGGEQEQAG